MQNDNLLTLYHEGIGIRSYEFFGCHKSKKGSGYVFRVWAPHAEKAFVVGLFGKEYNEYEMVKLSDNQSFEVYLDFARCGDLYKFCMQTYDGRKIYKADPYAFKSDFPNSTNSVIFDELEDAEYERGNDCLSKPFNVYEVNLLSWKKWEDGSYYSYKDLENELVPYVKNMGYTHVEFMPITEYPFDGSWGYQVTGYFSIVNRLGSPQDFQNLVKAYHKAGIKVILDWVPAHFPKDEYALFEFDGQPLYECPDMQRGEHKGWGTRVFDFGRPEIESFLLSAVCYFLSKFAIDVLRIDAVSSMLYLDYDKKQGEWTPNIYGDNKNLEAIAFIRKFNTLLKENFQGLIVIAEESSAFDGVTRSVDKGGLGFDYKWNMGWMNDVLFYCRQDPIYRKHYHNKMTFSMVYAFSENYVLPLSHDEVVHVKGSILNKMTGEYDDKFAGERLLLAFMFAHPGKKLNFMGYEIGQFSEWNYATQIDWFLTEYEKHAKMQRYVKELNLLYKQTPALFEIENSWDGFEWLIVDDDINNVFAFNRYDKNKDAVTCIFNFSGIDLLNFRIGIDEGKYRVLFNTDKTIYGGNGKFNKRIIKSEKISSHNKENSIILDIPKLTCIYLIKQ